MTKEDIMMELETCKIEFERIHKEFKDVDGFEKRMELINKEVAIINRMEELHNMNKKTLLEEFEAKCKELLEELRKMFIR